jgi:50S ribosomal subunit-associated GTPase HflX
VRLDAVTYLFEREGTNCENLPETHEFLRELRAHVDTTFPHVFVSARAGTGVPALLEEVARLVNRDSRVVRLLVPFARGDVVAHLRERGRVLSQEFRADGVLLEAAVPLAELSRLAEYIESAYVSNSDHRPAQCGQVEPV